MGNREVKYQVLNVRSVRTRLFIECCAKSSNRELKSVHGTGLNKKRPSALEIKASSAIKTLKIVTKGKYNGWGAGEVFTFPLVLVAPPPLPSPPPNFFSMKRDAFELLTRYFHWRQNCTECLTQTKPWDQAHCLQSPLKGWNYTFRTFKVFLEYSLLTLFSTSFHFFLFSNGC